MVRVYHSGLSLAEFNLGACTCGSLIIWQDLSPFLGVSYPGYLREVTN
jgi:hypothetical protein